MVRQVGEVYPILRASDRVRRKLVFPQTGLYLSPMPQVVDTLIHPRWIIPVEPDSLVFESHSIAVQKGHILDILPRTEAAQRYTAHEQVDLPSHILVPGFVNAHTHAAMTLFRGMSNDLPLMEWLNDHIWPAETRWVSEQFVRVGTSLAMAEMLRSGTTCFNDMYFFPDVVARVAQEVGMRASVGLILIDFPTAWAGSSDEYLRKGLAVHDEIRPMELVTTAFAPHAPYTVSDPPLTKIRVLADELDIPVHMHVHETQHEIDESLTRHRVRPLERLSNLGLLTDRLMAVHMTKLLPQELEAVAQSGANVVHCPESNLKLASGLCAVKQLLDAGANVALGTDGAASNNDLDMLGELRTAALLAKGASEQPTALPAHQALSMATINGARALRLDGLIGSVVAGKSADLVAVDLSHVATQPVYDPVAQLVYSASRDQVTDVWVQGRRLLAGRRLTTIDESQLLAAASDWATRIASYDRQHSEAN